MKKNQNGFSLPHILLFLVIVAILGFAGWRVYDAQKNANNSLSNASNANEVVKQEKKEDTYKPVIPEGWKTYSNNEYGFSFAYPQEWGNLEAAAPGLGTDYDPYWLLLQKSGTIDQREKYGIKGTLTVAVVSFDFKEFRTVKAGTALEYKADDGGHWIASTKVDLEFDDFKPGDKVSVPVEKKINGTTIFRVEGGYECDQNAEWWFATKKGVVQIAMPRFNKYVGESTGVCASTKQVSEEYWRNIYKQILYSINILS
jgi:hypothetical protein